jgi:acetyltransferase-like isoleucine patch superfamily enzyme/predicted SAM-dependent methyltransferase
VLEIGPGSLPFPRADIFLEKKFDEEDLSRQQRGFGPKVNYSKPIVFYDGGRFPFADNEFDYVVCSHVIEHIPFSDLVVFISELQRVAPKGYIEFPNVLYELINYQPVHLWFMNFRNNQIIFLDKQIFRSNLIHLFFRELFYGDQLIKDSFNRHKEIFFEGFEWEKLDYKIVNNFDELVAQEDFDRWQSVLSNRNNNEDMDSNQKPQNRPLYFVLKKIYGKFRRIINSIFKRSIEQAQVHRTAQVELKKLVHFGDFSEIKDYVIIRTYIDPVIVGKHTQINPFTVIYGGSGVFIGNNVMIGPHCMIASGNHDYIQTEKPMRFAGSLTQGPIFIEDNVWIAANCTITDGVRIGHDAVIAANSVVTKDVAPNDIVGGVPAKVIRSRLIRNS